MKRLTLSLILGVLLAALTFILFTGRTVRASDVSPRFEHIYSEELSDGHIKVMMSVYHDKATGAEFVCSYDTYEHLAVPQPQSCFLTGRKW